MANTYTQIYIQTVFAVQNRNSLIQSSWEEELYKYITGIVQNKGQKMLAINGTSNHIHFFIGMKPDCCLSDLVREIKKSSNRFIKEKRFSPYSFKWQEGFGAFSYSHSQLTEVIQYIEKQKEHHKKHTFKDEYLAFLKAFDVDFKKDYLFEWIKINIKGKEKYDSNSGILLDSVGSKPIYINTTPIAIIITNANIIVIVPHKIASSIPFFLSFKLESICFKLTLLTK